MIMVETINLFTLNLPPVNSNLTLAYYPVQTMVYAACWYCFMYNLFYSYDLHYEYWG